MAQKVLDVEDIRRLSDLGEVISAQVALKRVGRRLRGVCPFHSEKSPSFYVDPDKGLWHCFGCKAGGDVFRFVELSMGLSFPEAAQWLARRLGGEFRRRSTAQTSETQRLADMNSEAAGFFRRMLFAQEGEAARAYLEERGLSSEEAIRFGLGYAPQDWSRLFDLLRDKGFGEQEIFRSGLCLSRPSGGGYDRFRNRLIFSIFDTQQRIVGFGGRALAEEDEPKYLNSPETPLFQKGRTLYGLSWASRAIASRQRAVVVEGYFDLIRCHLCGIEEAVATLGTALTAAHLVLLRRRRTEKVFLAFDADSAGLRAALRSREIGAEAEVKVLAAELPAGHDPDSYLLSEGPEALEKVLAKGKPLVELTLEGILKKYEGQPANQRLGLLKEGAEILCGLQDAAEKAYYISWLGERYCGEGRENLAKVEQILVSQIAALSRKAGRSRYAGTPQAESRQDTTAEEALSSQVSGATPSAKLERQVLACLLAQPSILVNRPELIQPEDFCEPAHRRLAEAMLPLARQGEEPGSDRLSLCFEEGELRSLLAELVLGAEPWMNAAEVEKTLKRLQAIRVEKRRRELALLLEKEKEEEKRRLLQEEIHALARERSRQVGRWVVGE
ncbi:MAG: DNA primase [Armatimonadetes bacterium]|nr:DNA primase [Armatimonadota bacterium]NIM23254.1 DNA primase [Armatimonadota bacterium]NIM67122.1 DNA primase [Armatimonadota bacterium]NIM75649.1 DNA primase [Armatimonadota bacterium]NIN05311.1 DNA primase [Armatimonadota bacterium]